MNPSVSLKRGHIYPHVDMASIDPRTKSVIPDAVREYSGGGSRFEWGDTLMARITPCLENGKIARYYAPQEIEEGKGHGSTEFIVLRGREGISDSDYVYYLARSPNIRDYAIGQMTGTSGRQRVPSDCFDHISVSLPPIAYQRTVAAILNVLDEKIELNRRVNGTLESIAKAVFKDWFIDFGPVKARSESREPYLPTEIWGLFPESIDDTGLPKGWTSSTLGDWIEIRDSMRIPLSSRVRSERKGAFPYHGAAGVMDHIDDFLFEGIHVLVGEDGSVMKPDRKPFTQYVWGRFWVNNHAHVLLGKGISNEMLLCFLQQLDISPFVTGAVQPKLNQRNLKSIPFSAYNAEVAGVFAKVAGTLYEQVRRNIDECSILAEIRDLLLPKLMSGEIRIADAERVVESVT